MRTRIRLLAVLALFLSAGLLSAADGSWRKKLDKLLAGHEVQSLPHEQIISKLDEAGKTFHVLLLKTKLTLPYTSVFLQLDCGYWDAKSEKKLREAIRQEAGK